MAWPLLRPGDGKSAHTQNCLVKVAGQGSLSSPRRSVGDGPTRHALSWGHLQWRKPGLLLSCCGTRSFALSLLDTTAPGVDGVVPSIQDVLSEGRIFFSCSN